MIRYVLFFIMGFSLMACNQANSDSTVSDLLEQKISDVTEGEIEGIWEGRFVSEEGVRQIWRVRVTEDAMAFAVRCQLGSTSLVTGAEAEIELVDQSSRYVARFLETVDFRSSRGDVFCGARLVEDDSLFVRVDGLQLELTPGFEDVSFEKISDLED